MPTQLPMPEDMTQALELSGLKSAYNKRPQYQRNEYITWIVEGRREFMRRKRIGQMLEELEDGRTFMGKPWSREAR